MAGKPKDHAGKRFGKLVVLSYAGSTQGKFKALWLCKCDCGGEKIAKAENLLRGKTKHCGCEAHSNRVRQVTKHGRWATHQEQMENQRTRVRHAFVLPLLDAAKIVVAAANDNALPSAIDGLCAAIRDYERKVS